MLNPGPWASTGPPGPGPLPFLLLGPGAEWPELALGRGMLVLLLTLPAALFRFPLRAEGLSRLSSGLSGSRRPLGPCPALGRLREDWRRAEVALRS